jgi:hypothetical protein
MIHAASRRVGREHEADGDIGIGMRIATRVTPEEENGKHLVVALGAAEQAPNRRNSGTALGGARGMRG